MLVTDHVVETAGSDGRDKAMATLELAFVADPVMRWFWPDPTVYRATFSKFVEAIAGAAFKQGTAQWLDSGHAVALWLAPGVAPDDETLTQVIVDSVEPSLLVDLAAFGDLIHEQHPVVEHWYLPFTGVDPFFQGTGLGTSLLRHALANCDRQGLPAYLEASTTRSRLLYERLGFKEISPIQTGASPRVWAMLRDPQMSFYEV